MRPRDERLIERYFEGESLSPPEQQQLFSRVADDEECRAYFDELAEAERLLSGGHELPSTQLDLIKQAVLSEAAPSRSQVRSFAQVWRAAGLFGAVAAAGVLFVVLGPERGGPGEFAARGGSEASLAVEALCFDAKAEVVKSARSSTDCPAPGFVKLLYASPRSAPRIAVVVRARTESVPPEVRVEFELETPSPRSILPGHARIELGETLEIYVADKAIGPDQLEQLSPVFTIAGVSP